MPSLRKEWHPCLTGWKAGKETWCSEKFSFYFFPPSHYLWKEFYNILKSCYVVAGLGQLCSGCSYLHWPCPWLGGCQCSHFIKVDAVDYSRQSQRSFQITDHQSHCCYGHAYESTSRERKHTTRQKFTQKDGRKERAGWKVCPNSPDPWNSPKDPFCSAFLMGLSCRSMAVS